MEYRWINNIEEFKKIAAEWDKALADSGNDNPFLLSDYIITWWKYYNTGRTLAIFVIMKNAKIAGGLPLYSARGGIKSGFARILSYIGDVTANYTDPFYAKPVIELIPVLYEALSKKNDWDALHLKEVEKKNALISEYNKDARKRRFSTYAVHDHLDWAVDISSGKDNYLMGLAKKFRRDLRSKRKYAIKNYGSLTLKEIKGKEEVGHYFKMYSNFSINAFDARKMKSNFQDGRYTSFFNEFLSLMDRKRLLKAHVLYAGDKVLAISFAYISGNELDWILTAYNQEYKYVRPGYLLIEELIEEMDRSGITRLNWYGYEAFYKTQWCNKTSGLYQFLIFNKTIRALLYRSIQSFIRFLKSNPIIVKSVRRIRKIRWRPHLFKKASQS